MTGGHQQGEPASGAESDHADPAVTARLPRQPGPRSVDLAERLTPARPQLTEHPHQAHSRAAPETHVSGLGQVPGTGPSQSACSRTA